MNDIEIFQKLIIGFTSKGYIVSFDQHDDLLQISVQPIATGLGSTITINKNANWYDAMKTIEKRLFDY